MKQKHLKTASTLLLLVCFNVVSAQIIRISTLGQEGIIMGDITKQQINSQSAGYVDYGSTTGLEFNFYPTNKFGVGIRWVGTYYARDFNAYEEDLKSSLGIVNEQYDLTQSYSYWTFGSDIGVSYLLSISDKFQLEPYFYLGFKGLISPLSSVIYSQNNTTYTYQSKSHLYFGFNYSPGLKLHWNALKHVGLFLSAEYNGSTFMADDERTMIYSYDSFNITDIEKKYSIHAVNLGLGLTFKFGKGLKG